MIEAFISGLLQVFTYSTFPLSGPSGDRGEFLTTGYLGETAMAASKVVLAGILDECAGVQVVWSHLGGGLAMLMDRLDRVYERYPTCPKPPTFYLKRCFYDTVCTHGPALNCAHAAFGADRLVFGTDEPHVRNGTWDVWRHFAAGPGPGRTSRPRSNATYCGWEYCDGGWLETRLAIGVGLFAQKNRWIKTKKRRLA